ncbi:hypothetical protein [Xanthomarina gelatinilytica]|nr:hypothetical protein [Xanthomarina gelatinilytica]
MKKFTFLCLAVLFANISFVFSQNTLSEKQIRSIYHNYGWED